MEALIGPPHIHPTALHVVSTSMLHRGVRCLLCPHRTEDMRNLAYGLPRTFLLGTGVNSVGSVGRQGIEHVAEVAEERYVTRAGQHIKAGARQPGGHVLRMVDGHHPIVLALPEVDRSTHLLEGETPRLTAHPVLLHRSLGALPQRLHKSAHEAHCSRLALLFLEVPSIMLAQFVG